MRLNRLLISIFVIIALTAATIPANAQQPLNYELVVPFKYDYAFSFVEGMAAVVLDGKLGYIDTTGREVVPPEYSVMMYRFPRVNFSEGLARVSKGDLFAGEAKWGFIDKSGNETVPLTYDMVRDFSDGLAGVRIGKFPQSKEGFIDKYGNVVIPLQYDLTHDFVDGVARVELDGEAFYIDKTGKIVDAPPKTDTSGFDWTMPFSDGMAAIRVGDIGEWNTAGYSQENSKWGFINTLGSVVIQPQFDKVHNFSEGIAPVSRDGTFKGIEHTAIFENSEWGVIDKTGNIIIPFSRKYDEIYSFSGGLAVVYKAEDSRADFGLIDKYGNEVIPLGEYQYNIQFFEGAVRSPDYTSGLIAVQNANDENSKWGFIRLLNGENFDTNPPTAVSLAVVPTVIAGGVILLSKKKSIKKRVKQL
jgi:hypothetical protein